MGLLTNLIQMKDQKDQQAKLGSIEGLRTVLTNPDASPEAREWAQGSLVTLLDQELGGGSGPKGKGGKGGKGGSGGASGQKESIFKSLIGGLGGQLDKLNPARPAAGTRTELGQISASRPQKLTLTPEEKEALRAKQTAIEEQEAVKKATDIENAKNSADQQSATTAATGLREVRKQDLKEAGIEPSDPRYSEYLLNGKLTERTPTSRDDAFQAYADANSKDVKSLTAAEKIAAVKAASSKDTNKLPGALGELAAAHKVISDPAATPEDKAAAKEFITKENRVPQNTATAGETASDASEISQGIIAGTVPPDRAGLTRNNAWMKIQSDLQRKGFNLAKAELDWQAAKRYVSTLNSQQQVRIREAASTLSQMIPDVEQKYQDWQKKGVASGIKVFNKAGLEAAKNLPGEAGAAAQALETQIADMVSELGQVYMGGNSPTDHALSLAQKNLSGDWNKEQFDAAMKLLKTNLGYRVNSIMNAGVAGASSDSPYTPPGGGGITAPASASGNTGSVVDKLLQKYK